MMAGLPTVDTKLEEIFINTHGNGRVGLVEDSFEPLHVAFVFLRCGYAALVKYISKEDDHIGFHMVKCSTKSPLHKVV